jgi:hypothetical protein
MLECDGDVDGRMVEAMALLLRGIKLMTQRRHVY